LVILRLFAWKRARTLYCGAALSAAACQFPDYELLERSRVHELPSGGAFLAGGAPGIDGGGSGATPSLAGAAGTSTAAGAAGKGGSSFAGYGGVGGSGAPAAGAGGAAGVGGAAGASQGDGGQAGLGGQLGGGDASEGGDGGAPALAHCSELPISARSAWDMSTSHPVANAGPERLLDNKATRWTTGKAQSGDEWLKVDFGKVVRLNQINLQQGPDNANDYPRGYQVYVSNLEQAEGDVVRASGSGESGVTTTIKLASFADGRYLLIKQTGASLSWWSAMELEVSCIDPN
jgi:hypothetical protein